MNTKLCEKCNRNLDPTLFHVRSTSKDGLQHYCKDCFKKERPRCIQRRCETCKELFQAPVKEINRGNGRYCSIDCGKRRIRIPKIREHNTTCAYCSISFWSRNLNKGTSKSGLLFCCREHKDLAQRIGGIEAIQPLRYRGKIEPSYTYHEFAVRNHGNKCNRCGYDEFVIVHHKDRDRKNNSLENLEVLCPNCHALEHWAKK